MKNSQLCGLIVVIHVAPNLSSGASTFWAVMAFIAMVVFVAKGQ